MREARSGRPGRPRNTGIAVVALIISVLALGLHAIQLQQEYFHRPYALSVRILAFRFHGSDGSAHRFSARLAFANTGEQDVLVSGALLVIPVVGEAFEHLVEAGSDSRETSSSTFLLAPGEKAVREIDMVWNQSDIAGALHTEKEGTVQVQVRVVVTFLGPDAAEYEVEFQDSFMTLSRGRIVAASCNESLRSFAEARRSRYGQLHGLPSLESRLPQ